jgi:hypothetical protein
MLPADGGDQTAAQQVGAQGGQGPPPAGEPDGGRALVRQMPDGREVPAREARVASDATFAAEGAHAFAMKRVQIRVTGVRMHSQKAGDVRGAVPGGEEQEGLGPPTLPGPQGLLEESMHHAELGGGGLPDVQRTHGRASRSEEKGHQPF